jgi:nitrogen-specific signal transduction histidine kinase
MEDLTACLKRLLDQLNKDILFSPLTIGKAKGRGGGFAVVKRIVEAHNGTIEFESEKAVGTTFNVTLPRDDKI